MKTCLFQIDGEGPCWHLPVAHGYCREHIGSSPEERSAYETLLSRIQWASTALDECGAHILKQIVVFGDGKVPDELAREYRNLWYRHNYLTNVRNGRTPGQPLPAEVTMRPEEVAPPMRRKKRMAG